MIVGAYVKKVMFGVCGGLLIAGCASVQNTPAQDRTWNAYRVCTTETGANAVMQRVDPDGRYYVLCSDRCTHWAEFTDCMREKTRAPRGSP
jgi:hypothetical protein